MFEFPLEALLQFRRNIEHREWLILQQIATRINAAKEEIHRLHEAEIAGRQVYSHEMRVGVCARELHLLQECEATNERRRKCLIKQISELEQTLQEQRRVLQSARRDRDSVEKLRERAYSAWQVQERRREQAAFDELHLLHKRG